MISTFIGLTKMQFSHILPVKNAYPMLVSYGADEAAIYMTPNFSYIADMDGEVIEVNPDFVVIKYKDGTIKSYKLNIIERNSAKGYFIKNDFEVNDKIKKGKKVKKGSVLAYNKDFYKKKSNGAIALCAGPLIMNMITDGETWEDACIVSESISDSLSVKVVKRITAKFDMTSTDVLEYNMNIGSEVDPSTLMMKFNDLTTDSSLNDYFEDVEDVNTKEVTSHYKGTLNDINIYYRLSRNTKMTESVKRFMKDITLVQNNTKHMKSLDNVTSKFDKAIQTSAPIHLTKGKFSKINGDIIENGFMLVEFNVEVIDKAGSSDKIVIDRALKNEISSVIKDEDRPTGTLTGRASDLISNTQSVNARKTPGLMLHGQLLSILLHVAIKNRMILNKKPEAGTLLDYKSSMDMVNGKLKYKD